MLTLADQSRRNDASRVAIFKSITTAAALFGKDDLNAKTAFFAAACSVAVPLILSTSRKTMDVADAPGDSS